MHYTHWKLLDTSEKRSAYMIDIPNFFRDKPKLQLMVASYPGSDSSVITVFKNGQQLVSFIDPYYVGSVLGPSPKDAFVEDVNGDGLKGIKLVITGNGCCGAYNFYTRVVFLFQDKNGGFTKIAFSDLMMEYQNRLERDFDGDGNFEIIVQRLQSFGDHNYFLFNLYNYKNGQLVNVNNKANYPIMVQLLYRQNYTITNKISRKKMKEFSRPLPDDYDKKQGHIISAH
jgi:hypothetical protein